MFEILQKQGLALPKYKVVDRGPKYNEDRFEIYGSKGSIKFSMNRNPVIDFKIKNKNYKKRIIFEKPHHKNLIRDTINYFRKSTSKKNFLSNKNGFSACRVQFNVYKNAKF